MIEQSSLEDAVSVEERRPVHRANKLAPSSGRYATGEKRQRSFKCRFISGGMSNKGRREQITPSHPRPCFSEDSSRHQLRAEMSSSNSSRAVRQAAEAHFNRPPTREDIVSRTLPRKNLRRSERAHKHPGSTDTSAH